MKLKLNTKTNKGFTLIEMIGVLAVIAILAALLIPKVFEAINNARVSNASITLGTVKTAVADHYAKFGSLAVNGTTTPPGTITVDATTGFTTYDQILLGEGFLDKPFAVKIGNGNDAANNIRLATVKAAEEQDIDTSFAYDLDGDTTPDTDIGTTVVEAVIAGVSLEDARALDRLIDGATMSSDADDTSNYAGRVKWLETSGICAMNIYITHR